MKMLSDLMVIVEALIVIRLPIAIKVVQTCNLIAAADIQFFSDSADSLGVEKGR